MLSAYVHTLALNWPRKYGSPIVAAVVYTHVVQPRGWEAYTRVFLFLRVFVGGAVARHNQPSLFLVLERSVTAVER